jgi:CTP-dependent riboflavin kinase
MWRRPRGEGNEMVGQRKAGQTYEGIVVTGRGGGAVIMSAPSILEHVQRWTGLAIIPGTLNVSLTQPFDVPSVRYVALAAWGLEVNLAPWGIDYTGEQGFHYSRVCVAHRYPALALCFTWVGYPSRQVELISNYHLRSTLGLQDQDAIAFTVVED